MNTKCRVFEILLDEAFSIRDFLYGLLAEETHFEIVGSVIKNAAFILT